MLLTRLHDAGGEDLVAQRRLAGAAQRRQRAPALRVRDVVRLWRRASFRFAARAGVRVRNETLQPAWTSATTSVMAIHESVTGACSCVIPSATNNEPHRVPLQQTRLQLLQMSQQALQREAHIPISTQTGSPATAAPLTTRRHVSTASHQHLVENSMRRFVPAGSPWRAAAPASGRR